MNILFLILARGGSKRLKNKNIRPLGEMPLIMWTINHAKLLSKTNNIFVSTDDPKIKEISVNAGVNCPQLRPSELARDETNTIDVVIHEINCFENKYRKLDGVFLLQPTTPFREIKFTSDALSIFLKEKNSIISVTNIKNKNKNKNAYIIENDYLQKVNNSKIYMKKTEKYFLTGSFYISTVKNLKKRKSFFSVNTTPYVINDKMLSIDIDYIEDFEEAERYV